MRNVSKRYLLLLALSSCCWLAPVTLATNAPSNLVATGLSSNSVSLTWTDNSTNESGFTFVFDTNPAFTSPSYVWAGGANTVSYTHTGRNAATTYYYRIKAEGSPDSAWTAADSATTAPSSLAATATSNSAMSLTWTGNGSNTDVTGYTYAYANNSAFTGATYVWVAGAGSTSATRSGLATATTYWVKIKAEGTVDATDSPYGNAVATTTTPAGLTATVVSNSQVNLSWSGNSGNPNIVGYTVARANNSSFTSALYTFVSGAGATSFSSTGLTGGTTYWFKVKAEGTSDAYDSPFTASITATPANAAPNAPSNLAATVVSSSQINLSWTDNSTNETAFELKRATDSAFTQNVAWIGGIQGATYSNTGLAAGTTYWYKVRAKGTSQDSVYSPAVSATTQSNDPLPAAPSGLTVTSTSSSSVTLTWTDNSTNETGFEVKRATDSAFTQSVSWVGGIGAPPHTSVGLSPNTTYYFKVRAEGVSGKSAYSPAVSATTSGAVSSGGVPISPRFFGINAWMPAQISGEDRGGKLDLKWDKVRESRPRMIRYGGIGVDEADPYWYEDPQNSPPASRCAPADGRETAFEQYAAMVDSIRNAGAEPILQVPVNANRYTPAQAAALVQCINGTLQKNVRYWSVGNEPDNEYLKDPANPELGKYRAAEIAAYMRDFAAAMKAVDSSIKIVGPETAWYHPEVLDELLCGAYDLTGKIGTNNYSYLDVISFHSYPWPTNGGTTWPTRDQVITKLSSFAQNLSDLSTRVSNCNSTRNRTGDSAVKIAVTEANINYNNPSNDSLDGVGATSFLGGQFWAEMMGVALRYGVDIFTFWSVIEGNSVTHDKGYLCRDLTTIHPSYHHFKMMAETFRGNSIVPTDSKDNVKTFAAQDTDQVAVILINQDGSSGFDYTVRLDATPVSNALTVNVPAGIGAQSTGNLARQSTILLVFDNSGTLKRKIEYKRYGPDGVNPSLTDVSY